MKADACVWSDETSAAEHDINVWLAAIEQGADRRKRMERWRVASPIPFWLTYTAIMASHVTKMLSLPLLACAACVWSGLVAVLRLRLPRDVARQVVKQNDARLIGALVDIWDNTAAPAYSRSIRDAARHALTRLLPTLSAANAGALKEHHRVLLRHVLTHCYHQRGGKQYDPDFQLAIIQAFERSGDWRSAASVRYLTFADDPAVREAARRCVPYLQGLAEARAPGESLLRASDGPGANTPAGVLLRPARGSERADDPAQLLRAVQGDDCIE